MGGRQAICGSVFFVGAGVSGTGRDDATHRTVRRKMDSALLSDILLPPPASGTRILSRLDGASAGCAADTGVAARIERMQGNVMFANVPVHLRRAPVHQGVDLE